METWRPGVQLHCVYGSTDGLGPLVFAAFFVSAKEFKVKSREPERPTIQICFWPVLLWPSCALFFFVAGFLAISWALVNANLLLLLLLALSIIGTEFRMHLANHNHDHRATQIKASAPPDSPHFLFFCMLLYVVRAKLWQSLRAAHWSKSHQFPVGSWSLPRFLARLDFFSTFWPTLCGNTDTDRNEYLIWEES